jgi:spore coat polysaccharide biosynthesis protein SpsF (cytidylyltransferase family)
MASLHATNLSAAEREHLTLHYYQHPQQFRLRRITRPEHWPPTKRHFTVDTRDDYEAARQLAERFETPRFPVPQLLVEAANFDRALA